MICKAFFIFYQVEDYITLIEIAKRVIEAGSYFSLFILILFALSLFFWHIFIKSYITRWAESIFNTELENHKNELNTDLGTKMVDLFGKMNIEIEELKSRLASSTQKRLGYHLEISKAYKKVYKILNHHINELTDFHHGGIDMWDLNSLNNRVKFLSNSSSQLRMDIAHLEMYVVDKELIKELVKIQLLIVENIYTPPKQFLLKRRELLGKNMNEQEKMDELNIMKSEFNESQLESFKKIAPEIKTFSTYFRETYKILIEKDV